MLINIFSSTIKFGELDLPITTIYIMIALGIIVFLGVGISSVKLIQSALENKEDWVDSWEKYPLF